MQDDNQVADTVLFHRTVHFYLQDPRLRLHPLSLAAGDRQPERDKQVHLPEPDFLTFQDGREIRL